MRRKRGQAITEYAAVMAFVSLIVALAFNLAQGSLFAGLSHSYSTVTGTLYALNTAALAAGH